VITVKVKKAVITAANRQQRALPLQSLVDRDGQQKTALCIIVEEVLSAGIEDICVVACPGDQAGYAAGADGHAGQLHFVEQAEPRGYGHAVYCARDFVGDEPFLHLVSDHLYVSTIDKTCARQLIEVAETESCAVSAVQATRENMLPYYGTVGGRRGAGTSGLYVIDEVIEKPTPTEAEQRLLVPGLRAGYYLCFFGMHVLTPAVMDILAEHVSQANDGSRSGARVQLSPALAQLASVERYLAYEVRGRRHDIGVRYGLLAAQLALALSGNDRDEVLAQMVELLAMRSN
jgi:UTP--glucose-1-phosphate uridylyltransferase